MSRATIVEVFAAICPWLAVTWCLLVVARTVRVRLHEWALLAASGLVAIVILLLPVQGLPVARWVAGLNANFSVPLTALLVVSVCDRVFARRLLSEREWATAWVFGAVAALLLYPMALGLGPFDPYEWGWSLSPLSLVIGALTAWLIWRQNRFGFVLLLAAMAFQLQLLESANYWDYLLDPIYSLVSIGWVAGRLATSTRVSFTKRYSKTLPRNISTI